jgi:hypothetical protein
MKFIKLFIFSSLLLSICGCQAMQQAKSPTETFKAYQEAESKKDAATIRQLTSKKSLEMTENAALADGSTLDEKLVGAPPVRGTVEYRNEKINGERATVEAKSTDMTEWDTFYFVKEDGRWKLAMDIYLDEMMKKADEEMKKADQEMNFNGPMPDSAGDNSALPNSKKK